MSEFFKYIGEKVSSYPQVTLSRRLEIRIQELTMEKLGMENINHLRDRYEGQSFLDNSLNRISGYLAVLECLDRTRPEMDIHWFDEFDALISYKNENCLVKTFPFGSLPTVTKEESKSPIIFVLQMSNQTYGIAGWASTPILAKATSYMKKGLDSRIFTAFSSLQPLGDD